MSHSDEREREDTGGGASLTLQGRSNLPASSRGVALYFMESMLTCDIPMTRNNDAGRTG